MKQSILLLFLSFSFILLYSQSVGIGTQSPSASSALEISATNKGILIPRITQAARIGIQNPSQGLLVYQTDIDTGFYFYKGTAWKNLMSSITSNTANSTVILYRRSLPNGGGDELWAVNMDGTNKHKVNIILPTGWELGNEEMAKVSANGLSIFFLAANYSTNQEAIYKCNIDGSNVTLIVSEPVGVSLALQSLY